jgi:peptidoglycan/LPS O-acetylase OafA/YrhL
MRSAYRPDIDGLRAIAVLLVIASHLHIPWLAGGYIGVDVFFVISGYLISSIIIPQITSGTFSVPDFYARRVRRIFPALIVMLAATIPFAWHFLFPTEMVAYARSLLAAVFACSNLLLWSWHGYFDTANELKPLLHTWSLGVEEQFYLAFPLILLGLARLRSRNALKAAICVIAVVSFAAACVAVHHDPHAAFFTIPLRAWELLLGAIVSQHYVPSLRGTLARNLASATGLLCILIPAALYTADTTFPGVTALPPCLGACLIIAAGETGTSIVGRTLSTKPAVFFGLISYSLYLWHWPVQVFANLDHAQTCSPLSCNAPMTHTTQLGVFALSVILATLSWRFVEQPFRKGRLRLERKRLFLTSGLAAGLVAATAIALVHTEGAPLRFTPDAVLAASQLDFDTNLPWRWSVCSLGQDLTSISMFDQKRCLPFTPNHRHYLLLGDSHAAQLWPGLSAIFPDLEIGQANVAGCNLLPNQLTDGGPICSQMAKFLYGDLLPSHRVDTLIVSALWRSDNFPDIARLVDYAHQRNIQLILIGPNIAYDQPLPRLLGILENQGSGNANSFADPHSSQLDAQMSTLAREQWHVQYISFFENLCPTEQGCPPYATPGVPMLLDSNHLTSAGSILFAQSMRNQHQLP